MKETVIDQRNNIFNNFGGDLAAGIVVFLVALPLCLGIALASGAPLFSGIITGIVGGIIVGIVSKSNLSVSGPAAGLSAIVLAAITELGAFNIFLSAVVFAGVIQLALGFLKAGTIADYFPSNVIEGMLAAIGIIIILKQIPHAVGFDKDYEGNFSFSDPSGTNTFTAIIEATNYITFGAVIVTVVSIAILQIWQKVDFLRKIKLLPGPLIVVVISILLNQLFLYVDPGLALRRDQMVTLPMANNFNEFLGQFIFPDFSSFTNPKVWTIGLTLAIVASIETLLCIEAVDKLDPYKRRTPVNHELKAQGIGNIVSGLIGGLPMTSVIVRSSANVNAGAKTKVSAISHGILLLICVATIPFLLNQIPLAALAAILILTGLKLARPSVFAHMWKNGRYQFVPFIVTIVAVVFTDLLIGVGLGLAVSIGFLLRENLRIPYYYRRQESNHGEIIHLHLAQEVSFLNKAAIKITFEKLPANSYVILDATETSFIDFDVCEIIRDFINVKAREKNIRVDTVGFNKYSEIENTLEKEVADMAIAADGKSVPVFEPKRQHDQLFVNPIKQKEIAKV